MFSFTLTLNPQGSSPMYEQLYGAISAAIRDGSLQAGERLPSKRDLCARLGVSRATVETAYELLRAEGYVEARSRSGFYAADYISLTPNLTRQRSTPPPPLPQLPPDLHQSPLSTSAVDVSLFPYASWAKLYKETVYNSPELLQRGDPQGELSLRQALSRLLQEYRGVRCSPEQLVVGSGLETLTEHLVSLLGSTAVYAMEDPGYPTLERVLHTRGQSVRSVPMDSQGMNVEALEASGANVAYLTPSHQFPLGITMPASRRSRLLRWAVEGQGWIIEDDYDSEFRYGGRPISSMQGMDRHGRVIYAGTFSRSLAPAIRLAYLVLPPTLLAPWQQLFGRQQSTVSRYEQRVMARFLEEGFYARYLRRVGKLYADRRAALLRGLDTIDGATVSGAEGGIHFLLTLPRFSETELLSRAAAAGIPLRGLSEYCRNSPPLPSTLVIGYGGLPTAQVETVVQMLRQAWSAPN
ncbi:MAG: PLP-dependent aminotransferase family protein [Oscillospiraceae bacterium]|nr:PLP-dependent aminotransferase family protein [Oscillospiraceae bacterium]